MNIRFTNYRYWISHTHWLKSTLDIRCTPIKVHVGYQTYQSRSLFDIRYFNWNLYWISDTLMKSILDIRYTDWNPYQISDTPIEIHIGSWISAPPIILRKWQWDWQLLWPPYLMIMRQWYLLIKIQNPLIKIHIKYQIDRLSNGNDNEIGSCSGLHI